MSAPSPRSLRPLQVLGLVLLTCGSSACIPQPNLDASFVSLAGCLIALVARLRSS